ncbi:MAG TPA: hypothetical protein VFI95_15705 [Terriglobales bacterium]|nr:hypothetical protein [Terriglobales bacterium]
MRKLIFISLLCLVPLLFAEAAELNVPEHVTAGSAFSISASGSGSATFYLVGPSLAAKRQVQLGSEIRVAADEIQTEGRYVAVVCGSDGCSSAAFFVTASDPAKISFLLHPSRVPVADRDAINATAFVFDRYYNPVLKPVTVDFQIVPKNGKPFVQTVKATRGVAWMRMSSTPKEGPVKVIAALGEASEPRVIQQVASEACHLRIKATRTAKGVLVETDPVRDCSGNAVPDGTIVSFTAVDANGKSTVDAPVKKGVARTQFPISGRATISVASGVVIGNEIRL